MRAKTEKKNTFVTERKENTLLLSWTAKKKEQHTDEGAQFQEKIALQTNLENE